MMKKTLHHKNFPGGDENSSPALHKFQKKIRKIKKAQKNGTAKTSVVKLAWWHSPFAMYFSYDTTEKG